MAHANGLQRGLDFRPPSSSMLATHVVNRRGRLDISEKDFVSLLQESLGHNDAGESNIRADAVVNQKLLNVIASIGLLPLVETQTDDPFRIRHDPNRVSPQLKECLDVLQLIVEFTPEVILRDSIVHRRNRTLSGVDQNDAYPAYVWLFSTLLPITARSTDTEISRRCHALLQKCLGTKYRCACGSCGTITEFARQVLSVITLLAQSAVNTDLAAPDMTKLDPLCRKVIRNINVDCLQECVSVGIVLITVLLSQHQSQMTSLQIKKQLRLLEIVTWHSGSSSLTGAETEDLRAQIAGLSLACASKSQTVVTSEDAHHLDSARASKRARLSLNHFDSNSPEDPVVSLAQDVTRRLTGQPVSDFDGLARTSVSHFRRLSEQDKCQGVLALGTTACYLASRGKVTACSICDDPQNQQHTTESTPNVEHLLETLDTLQSYILRSTATRIAALESYRRILNHTLTTHPFELTSSHAGKLCLQMLRSPDRDCRIRAAHLLRTLVQEPTQNTTRNSRTNRLSAFQSLATLWQTNQVPAQETVILCLFGMAEVVSEEELNIILLRVVEYLGHPNTYISGLVATELLKLANMLQTNLQGLLRPFWSTISVVIVKNLATRPVIAQTLCDLMGMQLPGLLRMIEEDALPYLVLTGQVDIIQRIGSAGSSPLDAFEVCTKTTNLPKILANLLAQSYDDPEEEIMNILSRISTDFNERDLALWLSTNHSRIACEILKLAADAGVAKSSKPMRGLELLAQLSFKKTPGSVVNRRSDVISIFLENNAWAMVTIFTSILDETVTRGMNLERRRCLVALGEIIRLGKGRLSFILPSICACLRSATADIACCDTAYTAWLAMFVSLEESDVAELVDQTLAVTLSCWSNLSVETREAAQKVLKQVMTKHREAVQEKVDELPSLKTIAALAKIEAELGITHQHEDVMHELSSFLPRLRHETNVVVQLAMSELVQVLRSRNSYIHASLTGEQPDAVMADLIRGLLDCRVKFADDSEIVEHVAKCLGAIGCVDPSRVESVREKTSMVVLSNFGVAAETTAFMMFFMENVVVKEYVSAATLRSKTFLGWALQELLKLCHLTPDVVSRTRLGPLSSRDRQWLELLDETRLVLTPFLTSKFLAPGRRVAETCTYPIFKPELMFEKWLTDITLELLTKGSNQNVDLVFDICWRMVHFGRGTAIAAFLLPYAAMNLLLNGTEQEKHNLLVELQCILGQSCEALDSFAQENVRRASQSVFDMLDYLSKWLQDKRKWFASAQARAERGLRDLSLDTAPAQMEAVEILLRSIPPQIITQRSVDCKSYARALLHWEEYIHSKEEPTDEDYQQLQNIYAQIDEPDGIEGISLCMEALNAESLVLEHKKAGRWQAAQNWYEMKMTQYPDDREVQLNLLHALQESGQHDVLLHHFGGICSDTKDLNTITRFLPYATQAAWSTGQFEAMARFVNGQESDEFNMRLASQMLLVDPGLPNRQELPTSDLWLSTVADLSYSTTATIAASCDTLLKTHVAEDLRLISSATFHTKEQIQHTLEKRLQVIGTDLAAKHYVSSVHRAAMQLYSNTYNNNDIAVSWLQTVKVARKARDLHRAFDAVVRAGEMGDGSIVLEQAKIMWLEGRHRKAIKTLESAIESKAFIAHTYTDDGEIVQSVAGNQEQNNLMARANVLLGKWLGQAGQTQSDVIIQTFRKSTEQNKKWERSWYHLGRHYNKILESERLKPPGKEIQAYLHGEATKTVIENFLRALACGNKYLFQTLPKVLTLWIELVSRPELELDARRGNTKFHEHVTANRKKTITEVNGYVKKFVERLQPVALYTILPQLVARICHPVAAVQEILQNMIAKVVHSFPQQSLWTLMAVTKSVDKQRSVRGISIIGKITELQKRGNKGSAASELRLIITTAQKFTEELLRVADYHIEGKIPKISLSRDLGFNHKIAPSKLVVPIEVCLIPNIPLANDSETLKTFQAFSKEPITISAFVDEALVLSSLQKPRKMDIRGSDGHVYAILAKPKDDLRKDQRLMEFDTMINRFLKRDIDASKRRLYIRTYAVIPLNEECGVIEWVNSLKTMREVLLKLYKERNVVVDYGQLKTTLDEICTRPAKEKAKAFSDRVLPLFPPVLRYWFIETFPDPSTWLAARIRYTHSAAVMSMVGHILGLGDRHGENILFEEENGGAMHVDFNCLFDKGLTFDKPECVPFRLTHNMVDAFGTFGVEGPFRRSCEITMTLLRSHEDGLMTILETFLHDPTTDFMTAGKRRKARDTDGIVPETAEKMLEGVKGKVRGMLAGESVPLSVSGYVEEMIRQACDRGNLAKMYIGWCAFL